MEEFGAFSKKREVFLFHILNWEPKLFSSENEDVKLETIIPLKLKAAKLTYDSFEEYYQTQLTFLIYHFWYHLKDIMKNGSKYDEIFNLFQNQFFQTLFPSRLTQVDSNDNRILHLKFKSLKPISPDIFYPSICHLIKLKLPSNEEQFGFVKQVSRKSVKAGPDYYLIYELITKYMKRQNIPDSVIIEPVSALLSTYMTFVDALINLQSAPLRSSVLNPTIEDYKFSSVNNDDNIVPIMEEILNPTQLNIVSRIIKTIEDQKLGIFIVSAPAATGKTTIIVSSILSIMSRSNWKKRILVCGQSNSATDAIVLELLRKESKISGDKRLNIVRFGPHEKINEQVKPFSFSRNIKDVSTFLREKNVIFSTMASCANYFVKNYLSALCINTCIIDDASQPDEIEISIPMVLGVKTMIVFGDPKQYCPKIYSEDFKGYNLSQSLLVKAHKIFENHPENPILTLDTQYRIHESIVQWPNKYFYKGELKNCVSIRPLGCFNYRVLNHLSNEEEEDPYVNIGEAKLVINIAYTLITELNLTMLDTPINLGIIALSEKQRCLIAEMFNEKSADIPEENQNKVQVSIKKMSDAFQGSQLDIIILSVVRSAEPKLIDNPNKLCVSLTRAKHTLVICGNFSTYNQNNMWDDLIKDSQKREMFFTVDHDCEPPTLKQYLIPEN